jgi:membrane-bound serine protease (ClpP class)
MKCVTLFLIIFKLFFMKIRRTNHNYVSVKEVFLFLASIIAFSVFSYAQTTETADTLVSESVSETISTIQSGSSSDLIYVFEIREEIAKPAWRRVQMGFDEAVELDADLVLIHMNTYGGEVSMADSIRTKILQSEIPVYVFIDNNAASAGALISIACDSIYMRPGANIGAATVVNQEAEALPDKYQSYMRSMMRSTAETNGRDPNIAEAMVDPDVEVEGISKKGKVLTFTTKEAIENGFCEGEAETYTEVIKQYSEFPEARVVVQELSSVDNIIGILISPFISGILIMVIIGGIYFELQSPGMGFPSIAAVAAAIIYFAPLYLEGLAANWEIVVFIVGIILVMVEVFAIPGFGVAGVSGIILIVLSLSFSMVGNVGFTFSAEQGETLFNSLMIVIIASTAGIILSFSLAKRVLTSRTLDFALNTVLKKEEGFVSSTNKNLEYIGKTGIARTVLRPGGKVEIDNEVFDAVAETRFIEKGTEVIVTRYQNSQLFVKEV